MKGKLIYFLCCFIINHLASQKCIDTVSNSLTLLSKIPVSGNDCKFSVKFCVRKVSEQADHILYSVYHTNGTQFRTIYIYNEPVGAIICQTFNFVAHCDSKAQFHAHGKNVSHVLCGAVEDNIILPIRLIDFSGEIINNGAVLIKWQTAYEQDVSHINLQFSEDGIIFHDITKVNTGRSSESLKSYSYLFIPPTRRPPNEFMYFRLKTVDLDQSVNYSQLIAIKNKADFEFQIFPNVVQDFLFVSNGSELKQDFLIRDLQGNPLPIRWLNETTIYTENLPPGVYFIQYKNNIQRFLKN